MKNQPINPFYSVSSAVFIGAIMISISILMHGGIIKVGSAGKTTAADVVAPTVPTAVQQPVQQAPAVPQVTLDKIKETFNKSQIKFGDENKKLIALEIADPSCPFCHVAAGLNPSLNKQIGPQFTMVADGGSYIPPVPEFEKLAKQGKIAFSYIYFPGHGSGEMGAKAMYCAQDQGKFWEVHNKLMTTDGYDLMNNKIKNDKAKSQEMADFLSGTSDTAALKTCLDSGKYDARLQQDVALANALGVSGTPGFFINETPYSGAYSYKDMESTVNSLIP